MIDPYKYHYVCQYLSSGGVVVLVVGLAVVVVAVVVVCSVVDVVVVDFSVTESGKKNGLAVLKIKVLYTIYEKHLILTNKYDALHYK